MNSVLMEEFGEETDGGDKVEDQSFGRRTKKALLLAGVLMLTVYAGARLDAEFSSRLIFGSIQELVRSSFT